MLLLLKPVRKWMLPIRALARCLNPCSITDSFISCLWYSLPPELLALRLTHLQIPTGGHRRSILLGTSKTWFFSPQHTFALPSIRTNRATYNTRFSGPMLRNTQFRWIFKNTEQVFSRVKIKPKVHGYVNGGMLNHCRLNFNFLFDNTVEPLLSGHPLSGHPLLSGQLSKSRNYCRWNTINKTSIKRPPLLSDRGHLFAVPMKVFYCLYPY